MGQDDIYPKVVVIPITMWGEGLRHWSECLLRVVGMHGWREWLVSCRWLESWGSPSWNSDPRRRNATHPITCPWHVLQMEGLLYSVVIGTVSTRDTMIGTGRRASLCSYVKGESFVPVRCGTQVKVIKIEGIPQSKPIQVTKRTLNSIQINSEEEL